MPSKSPARNGPPTRPSVETNCVSAIAFATSRRGTSSAANACRAGAKNAPAAPVTKLPTASQRMEIWSVRISPASTSVAAATTLWPAMRILSRATRSATTPPNGVMQRKASPLPSATTPTALLVSAMSNATTLRAVLDIWSPIIVMKVANQK